MSKQIYIFLFFSFASILFAQNFTDKTISSIMVIGNDMTDDDVIKREMLINIGDVYSDSLIDLSEKRIFNLALFNYVDIIEVPDNNNVSLLISVTERFYLFPYPEFRIEDRDWDKLTYGFGMAHVNFRGRNEKLLGVVLFGYRPGFEIEYANPWIGTKARYTNSISIRKYSTMHRTMDFDENHFAVNWNIGRFWTRYFSSILGFYYDHVKVPQEIAPIMLSEQRKEDLFGLALSFNFDNRDLTSYPSRGWYTKVALYQNGFFEPDINYFQYSLEAKHYKTIGNFTLAGRVSTLQTLGDLPIYKLVYFGFTERLRGHFSEVYPGKHSAIANFEIRMPLLGEQLFSLPSAFLPPSSTRNLKFGLNAALFYDTGIVWSYKREFGLKNFLQGFGVGLHFRLPYVEVARLELAFDEAANSEIIFEVGTSL
ncbi:MAG: BamA/TamA family outer membrane protein [Calditrichaeota bacterium]|nr:BamA/TamA family outer membrane protein [Calditrichota bacterium]